MSATEPVSLNYELDILSESTWIVATPDPAVKQSAPHVMEVGEFFARERYYTRRRNLPSFLIKYTLSGAGLLEYGGREEPVPARRAFWIDCMHPQYYRTDPGEKHWNFAWVHFYGPGCAKCYEWFLAENGGSNIVELPVDTSVPGLIHRLSSIYRGGDNTLPDDVEASALVACIMAQCVKAASHRGPGDAEKMPASIADARAYLLEHYREPVTLSDLSALVSLDRFYFQKQFKRYTGLSPKRFQALLRLNRAKELLQTTDHPVSEISGMVGVESASRFIGLFRSYEGVTPGEYREKWRRK